MQVPTHMSFNLNWQLTSENLYILEPMETRGCLKSNLKLEDLFQIPSERAITNATRFFFWAANMTIIDGGFNTGL